MYSFKRADAFQSAVHLNPRTLNQGQYDYLCRSSLNLEVFRICRFALEEPFSCAHIDLGAHDNWAIRYASQNGHSAVVELLLQYPRVDPAARDNEAIRYASHNGHRVVVELLLQDTRVDPGAQINEAIRNASSSGHLSVVQLLLRDTRVDPTACYTNDALRAASERNYIDVCSLLLSDPRVLAAYRFDPFDLPQDVPVP